MEVVGGRPGDRRGPSLVHRRRRWWWWWWVLREEGGEGKQRRESRELERERGDVEQRVTGMKEEEKGVGRFYQNAPPFYLSFIFVPVYLGIGTASSVRTPNSNSSNVHNLIEFRKRLNKSNND